MMRTTLFLSMSLWIVRAAGSALTPETSLELRIVVNAALSPSGKEVAYRLERSRHPQEGLGGRLGELWVVDTVGGTPVHLADSGFSPNTPRWSPDGRTLAWTARSDPSASRQIYVRSRTSAGWGDVTPLTRAPGDVSSFQWSPDGSRIAYVSPDAESDERVRERAAGRDWIVFDQAGVTSRLYAIDTRTRATTLITKTGMTVWSFAWSPNGAELAIGASPDSTDDDRCLNVMPYVVSASGGEPRLIATTQGMVWQVGWSSDGSRVTWLGSVEVTDPRAGSVFSATARSGEAGLRNLTSGFGGTVISATPVPGRGNVLAIIAEQGAQTGIQTLELDSGRLREVDSPSQVLWGNPTFSHDGKTFSVIASSPRHPEEVFVGKLGATKSLRRLTYSNPGLDDIPLGAQEVTRWRSKDGLQIEGVLLRPVGYQPGKRYPVVIHVHGGSEMTSQNGWNGYGMQEATNLGQLLAAHGYLVLYPNYRGSSGRGVEFLRGNRRDVMGREWEDIESGLDHVIELGMADGDRAGIYGFSWGGYAAGWGATHASHRFKAAVAGGGIYDWISEAGTNNTRMHEQRAHWDAPLYENFLLYLERSPLFEVRRASTPVLMLHGERDESCPVTQAIEFHTALKWAKVPVELVIYPRQGHYVTERAHQLDYMERSLGWFDRYLSTKPLASNGMTR